MQKYSLLKNRPFIFSGICFSLLSFQTTAEIWQPPGHSIGMVAAYEDVKPDNEPFEGAKLLINAQTILNQ